MAGHADVRRLTDPPAIAMLASALLSVAVGLAGVVLNLVDPAVFEGQLEHWPNGGQTVDIDPGLYRLATWMSMGVNVALGLVAAAGAWQLLRKGSWVMGLTAAILLCVPCLWPCCCPFPAGIGIWAIVVLAREDVRAALDARSAATPAAFEVPPPPEAGSPGEAPDDRPGGGWGSG